MKKCILVLLVFLNFGWTASAQDLPSPEQTFGFRMGADKKLIDWQQINTYFRNLDAKSDRIIVEELGKSTNGKPFLLAIISSEENIRNLERLKSIQQQIAKPYSLEQDAAARLIADGKTVVLITLNIHSTEIASTQESVELLYEFATENTPQIQKILDNVVVLLIPSLNPDGQQLVVDWYRKTLGTEAEGSDPPELYHPYAGHDNNRDWFMYNLVESRHTAKILYHDWFPEIVYDQHQMGSEGARLFLPPYADPVNPNVPPLLSAQVNLLGKYVVAELQRRNFQGVATGTIFNAYFEGTMSKTPLWHNRIGILSEMASVNIASPIYFPKGSIEGMGLDLPENKTQTNFLDPWPGGWWRLRDIIDYEKAATYSLLDFAATFKQQVKTNFYDLNREAIRKGRNEAPYGYVIPIDQHDPNAAVELVRRLQVSGVEVQQLTEPANVHPRNVPPGSYYISTSQPARGYIKDLMEPQRYPDLKMYPGGPPQQPYDVTAWTLPYQMGVEALHLEAPIEFKAVPATQISAPTGPFPSGSHFLIERRHSSAYGLAHALLRKGVPVQETLKAVVGDTAIPAGTFVVDAGKVDRELLEQLSTEWQVPVRAADSAPAVSMRAIARARTGLYQPWITSMDEGWTRYVLDRYKIDYKSVLNEAINKKGVNLRIDYDVILLPDMTVGEILNGKEDPPEGSKAEKDEEPIIGTPQLPKKYQGGIGKEGVEALKAFVNGGGTLLALGEASNFAIEKLRLPAVNDLKGVSAKEFYAPGSIFDAEVDLNQPLAFGMQEKAHLFFLNSPTFRLLPHVAETRVITWYGEDSPLRSGYLLGEDRLHGHVSMAEIPMGKGRVILYGFRPQHRAQTYGTFKLLLNALFVSGPGAAGTE